MTCKKHPKYKIKRKPVSNCNLCWILWNTKQLKVR